MYLYRKLALAAVLVVLLPFVALAKSATTTPGAPPGGK